MASSAPRHRRTGSWLARILGLPPPPSPPQSDSESHRSTAADVPLITEIPTYTESSAQTDSEPLHKFLERVEAARKLIRDTIEEVKEPPIEKKRKVWKGHEEIRRTEMMRKPLLIERVQPAPVLVKEELIPIVEVTTPEFLPPSVPVSPPRLPQAPAPSPQSSSASSPSITFAREKMQAPSIPPPPPVSSFFVQKPISTQDFFEDPGFAAGAEDSSGSEGEAEAVPQTSLFPAAPGAIMPTSLFSGTSGTSLFSAPVNTTSLFSSGNNQGSSLFSAPTSLFAPMSNPFLQPQKPTPPTEPRSLFAPQFSAASTQERKSAFQPVKAPESGGEAKGQFVFASPIFTAPLSGLGQPGGPKPEEKRETERK